MIKDNKFMIMALLVSASTAVLAENVVEVNQSTTNYQEVNTEATSSDSTRLYLPTAGGVVWSISDPIILEKKLDVVSFQKSIATEIEKIKNPPIVVDHNPFAPKLTETLLVEEPARDEENN